MINPYSLLAMMQYGDTVSPAYKRGFGLTSTAGGATLARALQRRSDVESLEEYQQAEAERQKRGGLAGKGLGFLGGLAGAAIGGPAGAAIGSGLGTGFGERIFGGKAQDVDRTGTVYGQKAFRDVEEASKEYQKGMMGRAGMAGVKAGFTAGLTPGGGIYGQYNPLTATGRQGIKAGLQGLGVSGYTPGQSFTGFGSPIYKVPKGVTAPALGDPTLFEKFRTKIFKQDGGSPVTPFRVAGGGLIGMQYGGATADVEGILSAAGMTATPEQLALFEQFDPTQLQQVAKGLQQSLLSGTQQAAEQTVTSGFGGMGAVQHAQAQQRKTVGEERQSAQERALKEFESQTYGTAADIVAGGGEFGMVGAGTVDRDDDCYNDCIEGGGTPSTCTTQCPPDTPDPSVTLSCAQQGLTECIDPNANNYGGCGDCDYGE